MISLRTDRTRTARTTRGLRRRIAVFAAMLLSVTLLPSLLSGGGARAAAPPPGQGFTLNTSDLRFILKQITLAENNATREDATGTPVLGLPYFGTQRDPVTNEPLQVNSPLVPYGLRTVEGFDNNGIPGQSTYGAASRPFPRFAPAEWREAEGNPGFPGLPPQASSTYAQKKGFVYDSEPRMISNLIVDQTSTNPAAVAAAGRPHRAFNSEATAIPCTTDPVADDPDTGADETAAGIPDGCVPSHKTLFIPNVTTDVGLSPPFNSWFTLFGQFFDHGVDLTSKSGGFVLVPLKADDPLIPGPDHILNDNPSTTRDESADNLPANLRFMQLTRSTNQPGPDGRVGDDPATPGDESADDVQNATNVDSPWVDQSQTYSSHPSHQVFLRHYVLSGGKPISDGKLLEGTVGGMSTWADVKQQARALLGIKLVDTDVHNIPMVSTDQYGRFLRGPNGYPQLVTGLGPDAKPNTGDDVRLEGNPAANGGTGVSASTAVRINIGFLDDIAHHAEPNNSLTGAALTPDADPGTTDDHINTTYDDEMLARHFMAGDGRVNENIGLTAIHQVFHSEHNRLVADITSILQQPANEKLLAGYQRDGGPAGYQFGERLFEAARFVTEMEYQHLVFEEFARMVQPGINPFDPLAQADSGINPAVRAEFAHAVYRFGHSLLTETMSRVLPNGDHRDLSLLDAFLDPTKYYNDGAGGTLTPAEAAGSIAQGMTDQVANELDEFVTETLRNNLLGLPLDLPTINMARAREAGVPSLNNFRKSIFQATNDSALKPYTSWMDFGFGLKHQESLVNFVAAYGTHGTINGTGADNAPGGGDDFTPTLDSRRAAAMVIVDNSLPGPADREAFLNSTDAWQNTPQGVSKTGLDRVDLWVGGLAESTNLFGGLLGSTFNYVFEQQLTSLQDGDRLYYLSRTSGMNLLTQLEGNSFAELIERNTSAESLKARSFDTNDCEFELSHPTFAGTGSTIADDPLSGCDESKVLIRMPDGTIRYRQNNTVDTPGLNAQNMFRGTSGNDRMWGGIDNDTFWGDAGNDRIEGSDGSDTALGGEGNDIITDSAGDDVHKGGPGNDAIDAGPGLDILMGGTGSDFMDGGLNSNETFAGEGNDFVIAGGGPDVVLGSGGDDWVEGGNANDLLQGDSAAPFFDDINAPGSDVLIGDSGADDYDAEGGDDIMVAGPGIERNHGAAGYDWVTHARSVEPAATDLNIAILEAPIVLADQHLLVEAVSGWDKNDGIKGDNLVSVDPNAELQQAFGKNAVTVEGVNQITGLREILGCSAAVTDLPGEHLGTAHATPYPGEPACHLHHYTDPQVPGPATGTPLEFDGFGEGNILFGGGGSDVIQGRGADDIIDGDAWLDVTMKAPLQGGGFQEVTSLAQLAPQVFAGTLDPGDIQIIRQIKYGPSDGTAGTNDVDTAVYAGPRADYDLGRDALGRLTVTHARNVPVAGSADQGADFRGDGHDTLINIENLQFSDQTIVGTAPNAPVIGTATGGNASATVRWTPGAPNGSAVDGFAIHVLVNGVMQPGRTVFGVPANATSRVVTGLTNGSAYTFRVVAYSLNRLAASAQSNAVTPAVAPVDTTAPTVVTIKPANNATNVVRTANAVVTFSERVLGVRGGATATAYLTVAGSNTKVAAAVSLNAAGTVATINPNATLRANTRYRVVIDGGAGNIRDSAGNVLVDRTFFFRTR